ncbi:MAG: CocE/NonD family hydrolase [Candidatus Acidiferrales bacterium]|jgi:predicted acyl esterase
MKSKDFEYLFREPYGRPGERGAPSPVYSRNVESGMIIERNVAVRMRDGVEIYADVLRPADEKPAPPIVAWTPYGKHQNGSGIFDSNPTCEVRPGQVSRYATFEGPDPAYWVPRGYAIVNVDIRGMYYSKGDATFVSPEEAEDFYDLIEWAGTQPWSNGKVGLSGVSYLAVAQWRVAELHPPHLAAINPWEGWTDTYREIAFHGGIPDTWFWTTRIADSWGCSTTRIEDIVRETKAHPFFDAFWASKAANLSKVGVPAFVVACWADQGLHERGTLEGFKQISSHQKWLEIHGRKKWAYYYKPDCVKRLQEFFDHFLKGSPSAVTKWPRVRLEVREKYFVGAMRGENEWPIARTQYTKLYLDAKRGTMQRSPVRSAASCSYNGVGGGPGAHRAEFEITFKEPTELIGHMKLRIFMAAEGANDMDIFVGVYKFDSKGKFVPFAYYSFFDDGPVALGWLRASHRELDKKKSTEFQPVHAHQRELKLNKGEVVPLEIEIWPSGTRFKTGEKLRLIVQGTELQKYSKIVDPIYFRHEETVNSGRHVIHTGGRYDSYLLVPVIPRKSK